MARNEVLLSQVRAALAPVPGVNERRMFGGTAFMLRGKLCISVRAGRIMCRIDPALHEAALEHEGSRTVVMRGREYRGYLYVDAEAVRAKRDLDYWVGLALDYNKRAKASTPPTSS